MKLRVFWFWILMVFSGSFSYSNERIQVRLREMLEIPANVQGPLSLTLKEVTIAAMARSDSFKALVSKLGSIESDALSQSALTDAVLFAQAKQEWNRNQPNSLFGTTRFDQTVFDLGLEKRFQTGTKFNLGFTEYRNNSTFGGNFGSVDAKVAGARLELNQSLWRDFFGTGTRSLLKSGRLKSEANRIALESEIESWFIDLSGLYHQVWLAQKRVEATRESLKRKERLAGLFQRRKKLGISEEAEQIQIESAVEQSRVQLNELTHVLERYWKLLVVSLKLSEEDRQFNPIEVPIAIDAVEEEAQTDCRSSMNQNRQLKQLELELQAMELQAHAAVDQIRPDLSLSLGLSTNGSVLNANDQFSSRWSNALTSKYPAYAVGLLFRLPLDASAEKSRAMQATTGRFQLESKLAELKDQLISNLETSCVELKMMGQHDRLYSKIEAEMKRRIGMEETRYRQARVSPFTVLQAGEELYGATIALHSNLGNWWDKRWVFEKTKGTLFEKLDGWVKQKSGKGIFDLAGEMN